MGNAGVGETEDVVEDIPLPEDFDSDHEYYGVGDPQEAPHLGNDGDAVVAQPGADQHDVTKSDDEEVNIVHFMEEFDAWEGAAIHAGSAGDNDAPGSPGSDDGDVHIRVCECGCKLPYIRPRTYEYFKAHLDMPLWVLYHPLIPSHPLYSCPWSLHETVNAILGHVKERGPHREELESILWIFLATLPPRHVLIPYTCSLD